MPNSTDKLRGVMVGSLRKTNPIEQGVANRIYSVEITKTVAIGRMQCVINSVLHIPRDVLNAAELLLDPHDPLTLLTWIPSFAVT
ncbi:hypothetical protein TNCV_4971151 [Trichonephila clavipes]|nr:hypothetical protein TNCV_4971151 [Trichonephila clavipes]